MNKMKLTFAVLSATLAGIVTAAESATSEKWNGFACEKFEIAGVQAMIVSPEKPREGRPWVWCTEWPNAFVERTGAIAALKDGFHYLNLAVGVDCNGNPECLERMDAFYRELQRRGLAQKGIVTGVSRGGFYAWRFASKWPERVAGIYGDAPCCDLKSYPTYLLPSKSRGRNQGQLDLVCRLYDLKGEEELRAFRGNPADVETLRPIAAAKIPALHIVGESDEVVPPADNTDVLAKRFRELGGCIEVIRKPGCGHHPHGLENPQPILEFFRACYDDSKRQGWERQQRLFAELWHPTAENTTWLWPEDKVPLQVGKKPIKYMSHELDQRNVCVTDVDAPFFVFYPAPGEGKKPCVVVCPGGGYLCLGLNKEGTEIAEFLNRIGLSAAVLVYRAPSQREAALADAQRSIRLLRANADRYGIEPTKIGIIGFSAGANLTIATATKWRTPAYAAIDAADQVSCRPDFQLPIYPWDIRVITHIATEGWLKGLPDTWEPMTIRDEFPIDAQTPPAFIAQCLDDFCQPETALAYDLALRRAGVNSELHLYASGGHGFGLRRRGFPSDTWSFEAASWLISLLK